MYWGLVISSTIFKNHGGGVEIPLYAKIQVIFKIDPLLISCGNQEVVVWIPCSFEMAPPEFVISWMFVCSQVVVLSCSQEVTVTSCAQEREDTISSGAEISSAHAKGKKWYTTIPQKSTPSPRRRFFVRLVIKREKKIKLLSR